MADIQTEAGRAHLAEYPHTYTFQSCCPYPHGDEVNQRESGIHPIHQRQTKIEINSHAAKAIAAIEAEARRQERQRVRREGHPRGCTVSGCHLEAGLRRDTEDGDE